MLYNNKTFSLQHCYNFQEKLSGPRPQIEMKLTDISDNAVVPEELVVKDITINADQPKTGQQSFTEKSSVLKNGRRRAKMLDVVSRALFPAVFSLFVIVYWSVYIGRRVKREANTGWFFLLFVELKNVETPPLCTYCCDCVTKHNHHFKISLISLNYLITFNSLITKV